MSNLKENDLVYIRKNLNKIYQNTPSGMCSGCASCCSESVEASFAEFYNIREYIKKNKMEKEIIDKILNYYVYEYDYKHKCPFLADDKKCLIYDVRPLNCRIYGFWTKDDYEANYRRIKESNIEIFNDIKSKYNYTVNEDVFNYKIEYCNEFKPLKKYLTKDERLKYFDDLIAIDFYLYEKMYIDEFKKLGIVEHFINALFKTTKVYELKFQENGAKIKILKRLKKSNIFALI
ncbi:MAG: YkgJ family cysteine cluster protein [Peptostreptococcaceae bacterium]|jgi:Fe-S-cluster containining protein|nr:YkgJ family cysteine cluster protein [Peptostreptococcaceae bacterium]